MPSYARFIGLWAVSAGVHMAAFASLGFAPRVDPALSRTKDLASFEVVEVKPEETPDELAPPPEPTPEPIKEPPKPKPVVRRPKRRPRPKPKAEPKPPPEAEPPPAAEAVADFTGVTMTAEGSSGWKTMVGNGDTIRSPVSRIATVTGRDRSGISGGTIGGKGPKVLTDGTLSRKPRTPRNLNRLLKKNYPRRAEAQGIEGKAVVHVRILPDGTPTNMRIKTQTGKYGFGQACIATLRGGGRWTPALDKSGRPGVFELDFTCTFDVDF